MNENTTTTLSQQYRAKEAEMLNTPKHNSHKRTRLVLEMKELNRQIKNEITHEIKT